MDPLEEIPIAHERVGETRALFGVTLVSVATVACMLEVAPPTEDEGDPGAR